jgi:hypothetical protein
LSIQPPNPTHYCLCFRAAKGREAHRDTTDGCSVPSPQSLPSSITMVKTRTGSVVIHHPSSYGRAGRKVSDEKRQRKKRKAPDTAARAHASIGMAKRTRTSTRAHSPQEESVATPGASRTTTPTVTTPRTLRPLHGRKQPTCSDFGSTRRFVFQDEGFHFCHPCDMWDALHPHMKKQHVGTR